MTQLCKLMDKYGSDKGPNHHNYTPSYYKLLKGLQNSPLVFVEVGIGGYHYPDRGGGSLKAWEEFFPRATVHGLDIHPKHGLTKGRVITHTISQTDEPSMRSFLDNIGYPDVFLDDGSHINSDVIATFEIVFPRLKPGGLYIVEDVETSYYPEHGFNGNSDPNDYQAVTSMNYFKKLSDSLNYQFIPNFTPQFKDEIESIAFYRNFIVITRL